MTEQQLQDRVAEELRRLVRELEHRRTAGVAGRGLREQRAHREGFTAAMKLVASSALLVQMLDDDTAELLR